VTAELTAELDDRVFEISTAQATVWHRSEPCHAFTSHCCVVTDPCPT